MSIPLNVRYFTSNLLLPPYKCNVLIVGIESYDTLLKVYKLARSNLAEILSSCELMDLPSIEAARENLKLSCPLADAPFFMLLETSGSNGTHDEEKLNDFLTTCMDQSLIMDGLTVSEPSKMRVNILTE